MKILYFAYFREKIGAGEEEISPPIKINTVSALIDWLKGCSAGHAEALADIATVCVAVNQEYANFDTPVAPNDEVALFPPVTGG